MSRYKIGGTVVDTENALTRYPELKEFDGNNHVSVHTKSQWEQQRLYRSKKGRYYTEGT